MKPTIYRITHLWPNKQPGQGSMTAQIEQDQGDVDVGGELTNESRTTRDLGNNPQPTADVSAEGQRRVWTIRQRTVRLQAGELGPRAEILLQAIGPWVEGEIEVVPASLTVQIKPETDEPNALPSRFVSLQDYEALEREKR